MRSWVKTKNVGRGEAIFRWAIGIIFILLAFFISGTFQWVFGLVGVATILTAAFGY